MLKRATLTTIICVCSIALGCGSEEEHRQTISLDGAWQVAAGSPDKIPEAFAHTAPVPGLLDKATPAFKDLGRETAPDLTRRSDPIQQAFWYRRKFKIDSKDVAVTRLKVSKARFGARVFMNGKSAGEHPCSVTPGWFNVRPFLKSEGGENELVIRIGASGPPELEPVRNGRASDKNRRMPGICGSVELILSDTPHVRNVQIAPDIQGSSVRVVAEIANAGDAPAGPKVVAIVREAESGNAVGVQTSRIDPIKPGTIAKCDITVQIANPQRGTPEDPFLYELTVDTGADTCKTRFAMRTLKSQPTSGRTLLKNGDLETGKLGQIGKDQTTVVGWESWGQHGWYHADSGQVIDSRAVKFWSDDTGLFQNVRVTPGKEYAFAVCVLNSAEGGDTLRGWRGYLRAEFHNASGNLLTSEVLAVYDPASTKTPLDKWEALSGRAIAPPRAVSGRIVLGLIDRTGQAGGSLDFDNASVKLVDQPKNRE